MMIRINGFRTIGTFFVLCGVVLTGLEGVSHAKSVQLSYVRSNGPVPPQYQKRSECIVTENRVYMHEFRAGRDEGNSEHATRYGLANVANSDELVRLAEDAVAAPVEARPGRIPVGGGLTTYSVQIDARTPVTLFKSHAGRITGENKSDAAKKLIAFVNANCGVSLESL